MKKTSDKEMVLVKSTIPEAKSRSMGSYVCPAEELYNGLTIFCERRLGGADLRKRKTDKGDCRLFICPECGQISLIPEIRFITSD